MSAVSLPSGLNPGHVTFWSLIFYVSIWSFWQCTHLCRFLITPTSVFFFFNIFFQPDRSGLSASRATSLHTGSSCSCGMYLICMICMFVCLWEELFGNS